MSYKEYLGWVQYFEQMNASEPEKPNMLASDKAMLDGFGL